MQETFSVAISGSGGHGNKGSKPKSSKKLEEEDDTSQASTSTADQGQKAEEAWTALLTKQNIIKDAWAKRNNVIYQGLGKMTGGAYEAALKNIQWDPKYLKPGKIS